MDLKERYLKVIGDIPVNEFSFVCVYRRFIKNEVLWSPVVPQKVLGNGVLGR